jgi:hypothetical protein
MNLIKLFALLVLLIACTVPSANGGSPRPDRRLTKEPIYEGTPRYYLLVFGPEAKSSVWLVFDGTTLYVDRNGNGDLTEPGERFSAKESKITAEIEGKVYPHLQYDIPDITERDGKTKHTELRVLLMRANPKEYGNVFVDVRTAAGYRQYSFFGFRQEKERFPMPATAPFRHFQGPLHLKLIEPSPGLVRGESLDLYAQIETPHEGSPEVCLNHGNGKDLSVPVDVHPIVTIELPTGKPGAKSVKLTVPLDQRC